jgi:GGDEF domain-containing protein
MDALTALTSVLPDAAFEANAHGHITVSNPPFVQLLRRVPGDDWRDGVVPEDRALVDAHWNDLFVGTEPAEPAEPVTFRIEGSDSRFRLRARTVTDETGQAVRAVGIIEMDDDVPPHQTFATDPHTGLPDRAAVLQRIDDLTTAQRNLAVAVVLLDEADSADDTRRKEAARQLLSTLRPNDVVSASPDGSFLVCAVDVAEVRPALQMAERIAGALSRSGIVARIGVTVRDHDAAPATLVREAEAGAYAANPGDVQFAE